MKFRKTNLLVAVVAVTLVAASMASAANLVLNGNFVNWTRASNEAYQKGDFWTVYHTVGVVAPSQGSSFALGNPVQPLLPLPDGSTAWDFGTLDGPTSVQLRQCQRIKLDSAQERGGVYQQVRVTHGVTYSLDGWMCSQLTIASQSETRMGIADGQLTAPDETVIWSDALVGTTNWDRPLITDMNTYELLPMTIKPTTNWVTIFLDGNHPETSTKQCSSFFDDIYLGVPSTLGLNNKDAAGPKVAKVSAEFNFKVWGKVAIINSESFTLDDGSGTPITVIAVGYAGILDGDYASAVGKLSGENPNRILKGLGSDVLKLN